MYLGDFLKLILTPTPDPIRSTRRGSDPNRPTYGSKEGGYDLGEFSPGESLVGYPVRQTVLRVTFLRKSDVVKALVICRSK